MGLEELNGNTISLFPNPFTETAVLDLGELHGLIQVEIFDVSGKLLRSEQLTTNNKQLTISKGTLSKGNYILRITAGVEKMELPFAVE